MRTLLSAAVLVLCAGVLNAATIHVPVAPHRWWGVGLSRIQL